MNILELLAQCGAEVTARSDDNLVEAARGGKYILLSSDWSLTLSSYWPGHLCMLQHLLTLETGLVTRALRLEQGDREQQALTAAILAGQEEVGGSKICIILNFINMCHSVCQCVWLIPPICYLSSDALTGCKVLATIKYQSLL